jgi:peptidoglycan/xylan/chitin deacetylase (PgdA/CDA1 family)
MSKHKLGVIKKILIIFLIFLIQGTFLYCFYLKEDFLSNFKLDYIEKIYLPIYQNELSNSYNRINSCKALDTEQQSVPVLLYHGVVDREDGSNILIDEFRDQMFALKKAGYQTITLEEFYKCVKGLEKLPEKSFLLTFDDGRKDSYYPVDPILKELDFKAVMFVITNNLGIKNSNFYLSQREMQNMLDTGRWDLQPHTRNGHEMEKIDSNGTKGHFFSNKLWVDDKRLETDEEFNNRIREDFKGAKDDLINTFGTKPVAFAFPFGDSGESTLNNSSAEAIIRNMIKNIYPISFVQVSLGNNYMYNYPGEDLYFFKRINVRPEWTVTNLLEILKVTGEKDLPFKDNFTEFNGWFSNDGTSEMFDGYLTLKSTPSTTGASIFLDGTYLWKNYYYQSDIDWQKGKSLSLIARFKDRSNYVSCNFSDKYVQIVETEDGKSKILNEAETELLAGRNNLAIGIKVKNRSVDCLNGKNTLVYSNNLSDSLTNGGIAMKVWDPIENNSQAFIKTVTVDRIDEPKNALVCKENSININNINIVPQTLINYKINQ